MFLEVNCLKYFLIGIVCAIQRHNPFIFQIIYAVINCDHLTLKCFKGSERIQSLSVMRAQHGDQSGYPIRIGKYKDHIRKPDLRPPAHGREYHPGIALLGKRHIAAPFQRQLFRTEKTLPALHVLRHLWRRLISEALGEHFMDVGIPAGKPVAEAAAGRAAGTVAAVLVQGDRFPL